MELSSRRVKGVDSSVGHFHLSRCISEWKGGFCELSRNAISTSVSLKRAEKAAVLWPLADYEQYGRERTSGSTAQKRYSLH